MQCSTNYVASKMRAVRLVGRRNWACHGVVNNHRSTATSLQVMNLRDEWRLTDAIDSNSARDS